MRVLWLTRQWPRPGGRGAELHEFELIRRASEHHDIVVTTSSARPTHDADDVTICDARLIEVPCRARPGPRDAAGVGFRLLTSFPSIEQWAFRPCVRAMRAAVRDLLERERFDLVHVTDEWLAPLVTAIDRPTALLLLDLWSQAAAREAAHASTWHRRVRYTVERWKLRPWESSWFKRATAIACVSATEAELVQRSSGKPVDIIPNPIPDSFFEPPFVQRSQDSVVFVGDLSHPPNIDAVTWLLAAIWPQVQRRDPHLKLRIVGMHPSDDLRATIESGTNVELHADVADVRPHYWAAGVVVLPVRLGSGMSNKVLHAMASGAPLVVTSAALTGFTATPNQQLLMADDAVGITEQILNALSNPEAARSRARKARVFAEAFRADAVSAKLQEWWSRAAQPA